MVEPDRPPEEPTAEPTTGPTGEPPAPAGAEPSEGEAGDEAVPGEGAEPGEAAAPAPARAEKRPTPPPPERLDGAVEAILLAAGEVLSPERIRDVLGLASAIHVRESVARLRERWAGAGLAVEIQEVAGGLRVVTRPEFAEYCRRLARRQAADRLSATLLETLSVVAYKQPVARVEIERIRGVQCAEALRGLLDRRLIKVVGRSEQPGRPLLYGTTKRFLETFGLNELKDLPAAGDLKRL